MEWIIATVARRYYIAQRFYINDDVTQACTFLCNPFSSNAPNFILLLCLTLDDFTC